MAVLGAVWYEDHTDLPYKLLLARFLWLVWAFAKRLLKVWGCIKQMSGYPCVI